MQKEHEKTEAVFDLGFCCLKKYARQDSNLQPSVPKKYGLWFELVYSNFYKLSHA